MVLEPIQHRQMRVQRWGSRCQLLVYSVLKNSMADWWKTQSSFLLLLLLHLCWRNNASNFLPTLFSILSCVLWTHSWWSINKQVWSKFDEASSPFQDLSAAEEQACLSQELVPSYVDWCKNSYLQLFQMFMDCRNVSVYLKSDRYKLVRRSDLLEFNLKLIQPQLLISDYFSAHQPVKTAS